MDQTGKIIAKIRDTIQKHGMFTPGDLVVVAVSGGPDSMCLLDALNRLSDNLETGLTVAHFNHCLRPDEDEEETRLVENFCKDLNLPLITEKSTAIGKNNISSEEMARISRYQFLERIMVREKAQKIAVGHNINDQAETVIMRILRGSGTTGISGIPPVRDNRIVRPLIEVSRKEIEKYCTTCNIPYAIDSSNRDKRFLRNRIRMELLPMMLEYQPRLIEHLGNLSDILRQEDHYLDQKAKDFVDRNLREETKGEISISLSSFNGLPSPLKNRTVRYLLKKAGNGLRKITSHHIKAVSVLAESSKPQGILNLPKEIVVRKRYERLIFLMGKQKESIDFEYILERPETIYLESLERTIYITEVNRSMVPEVMDLPNVAYLDADRVRFPLKVRNFRSGDRFTPLGMKGRRKVKDFFIDLKIPSQIRRTVPILINQEEVVWICGYRIDDKYKITPKTERVLKAVIG